MSPVQHTLSRQIMRKWEPWTTNTGKSSNHRMLQQLVFHKQQTIKTTRVQDLDPRSWSDNSYESVLAHEMKDIEPSEIPSRTLTLKPMVWILDYTMTHSRFGSSHWNLFLRVVFFSPVKAKFSFTRLPYHFIFSILPSVNTVYWYRKILLINTQYW